MNIVVASSKVWGRETPNTFVINKNENWVWVSNTDELARAVHSFKPRYVFFLHWSWIVQKDILDITECICFHMTDVPYGRGGSPLQNLIVRGHKSTVLTALKMVEEVDAGPIYCKKPLSLKGSAQDIYARASEISMQIARWIIDNQPEPISQIGEPVFFKRRTPKQSLIPKDVSIEGFYDYIRMLDAEGYPKAYIEFEGFRLELSQAELNSELLLANVKITYKDNNND